MDRPDTVLTPSRPFRVFISYAREDSGYLRALEKHLANLRQQGWIEDWSDRQFIAGDVWAPVLRQKLQTSELVLLLVSADFNASDFIQQEALPRIIRRHRHEAIRVVPILVRSADTSGAFVETVQCLPLDEEGRVRPIDLWPNADQAWLTVVQGLRRVLTALERVRRQRQVRHRTTAVVLGMLGIVGLGLVTAWVGSRSGGLELQVWAVASHPGAQTGQRMPLRPLLQGGEVSHSETLQVFQQVSQDAWGMVLSERRQGGMSILVPADGGSAVHWPSQGRDEVTSLGSLVLDASPGEERLLILAARAPEGLSRWLQVLRAEEQRSGALSSGWGTGWGGEPEGTLAGDGGSPPCPGGSFRPGDDVTRQLLTCFPETQTEQQVAPPSEQVRPLGTQVQLRAQPYSVLIARDRADVGLTWVWLRLNHVDAVAPLEPGAPPP